MTANARSTHISFARGRSRALTLIRSATLVVVCALAACSDDPASDSEAGDEVSALVGKKGGMLKGKGVTVVIPEDALDGDVTISIKNKGFAVPDNLKVKQTSDVFEFGPAGTKFKKDVEVQFQTEKDDQHAVVYFTKESSTEFVKIDSEKKTGESGKGPTLVAKTNHFSQGFVGIPDADELDGGIVGPDGSVIVEDGSMPDDGSVGPDGAIIEKHIVVLSKDAYGLPVNQTWAAYQDGDGAWQLLAPSGTTGIYQFDVTGSRYGVAFVCANAKATDSAGSIWFEPSTTSTLEVVSLGSDCNVGTAPAMHYSDGTLNLGSATVWRYGSAHETSPEIVGTGTQTPKFANFFHDEPNDLLIGSGVGTFSLTRLVFDRDLMLTVDLTGNGHDLVKQGTSVASYLQAQVSNASTLTKVDVRYTTRNTQNGLWLNTSATTGTTSRAAQFAVVPEGMRVPSDRYLLLADEQDTKAWRKASLTTYTSAALDLALPGPFNVIFASLTAPYLRPTYKFTPTADAEQYVFNVSYAATRSFSHTFIMSVDPAWLATTSSYELVFPDFSQVTGYNPAWFAPGTLPQGQLVDIDASVRTRKADAAKTTTSESGQRGQLGMPAL